MSGVFGFLQFLHVIIIDYKSTLSFNLEYVIYNEPSLFISPYK